MSEERKDYNQIKKSKKSRSPVFRIIGILLGASLLGGSVFGAYYTDQTLGSGFYQSPHFASVIDRMVYAATEVITAERKGETQDPTGDPGQGLEPLDSQEEEKQEEERQEGEETVAREQADDVQVPAMEKINPNVFVSEEFVEEIGFLENTSNLAIYIENRTDGEIIANRGFYDTQETNPSLLTERYPRYGKIKISSERGIETSKGFAYADFTYDMNRLRASGKDYEISIIAIKAPGNFLQEDRAKTAYDSYQLDYALAYLASGLGAILGILLIFVNVRGLAKDRKYEAALAPKRLEQVEAGLEEDLWVEDKQRSYREKFKVKKIPKEVTDQWTNNTVDTLNNVSKFLQYIKLEFKVLALFILYTQFFRAWDILVYGNYNMGRNLIAMLVAIVFGGAILYDFVKSDKETYLKNSYYNELKNRKRRYPKTKKGGTINSLALSMYSSFDLVFLLGGLVLLSLLFSILSGNEGLYVVVSASAGTAILVQCYRIRGKMVDERLAYMDEIAAATQDIVDGKMYTLVPEKLNDPMAELAHNINLMREGYGTALQEQLKSERMKTELIANVSHDLKTPLTSIINYVDLLKKEELLPEYARDYVMVLDQKSQRLNTLIQDLFEVSRAASGDIELKMEDLDVAQLFRQTLAELSGRIDLSELHFITNIPNQEVLVRADGEKLHRVFENLLINILKYSLEGSRVYIDIEDRGDIVIVMRNISNYEMNFTEEDIVQRFNRADSARSTEGSGLGLAICKSFLDLMGMNMKISTDGDLFKVEIRIHR